MRLPAQLLLAVTAVLLLGWLGWVLLFGGDAAPALAVRTARGAAVERAGGGVPRALAPGDPLGSRDIVRVDARGAVELAVGDEGRLVLDGGTTVRVLEVDAAAVQVELDEGRVSARVGPGGARLGVSSRGRAAMSSDGAFTVGVDALGGMMVAAEAGRVAIEGVSGVEALAPGEVLRAAPGEPGVRAAGPLLLEVAWPAPTREPTARVEGRTAPFARVRAGAGPGVVASADGRFVLVLPLEADSVPVSVVAEDPLGARQEASGTLQRDRDAPAARQVSVGWGP